MGTHLRVLSEGYPMNTNMTGFRFFSKNFASLSCALERSLSIGRINLFMILAAKSRLLFGNAFWTRAFYRYIWRWIIDYWSVPKPTTFHPLFLSFLLNPEVILYSKRPLSKSCPGRNGLRVLLEIESSARLDLGFCRVSTTVDWRPINSYGTLK